MFVTLFFLDLVCHEAGKQTEKRKKIALGGRN